MKKNRLVYFVIIIAVIAAWFILEKTQTYQNNQEQSTEKIKVVSSIYPLTDIIENIGKEKVEAVQILPTGASAHGYEPQVSDVKKLNNAKAVFYIGHGLDNWTLSLAESAGVEQLIKTDEYVQLLEKGGEDKEPRDGSNEDPHYWLSLENGERMARQVAEKLILLDSANEEYYQNNLNKYIEDMEVSKLYLESELKDLDNKEMVVYHNSWQYLAREFNLEVLAALKTSDAHSQGPKHLQDVYKKINENNIKVVYSEIQFSQEEVEPLAQDLDLEIVVLDPLGAKEEIDSYINLIEYNVLKIYEGQSLRN